MINYTISDINLNDDTPECKTPRELTNYIMSLCNKIYPGYKPDMKDFDKMTYSQVAYSLAKVLYSQSFEDANKATDKECEEIGLTTDTEEDLDKWSEIDSKYDQKFGVSKFMFLKWQAEKMMVADAFKIFEADPKIKKLLATNDEDYLKVKNNWEKPSIRSKVIDLAFKLRV